MRTVIEIPKTAKVNYFSYPTWQGYTIAAEIEGRKFNVYLANYRKGVYTWVTDYLYAMHYTKKTADNHLATLRTEQLLNERR